MSSYTAPTLPWLKDRQPPMVRGLVLSPDLEVAQRYADDHGLVTVIDIARITGASVGTISRWLLHPYWPPCRATLSGGERSRHSRRAPLYTYSEVQTWLRWALATGEPMGVGRKVRLKEGAR